MARRYFAGFSPLAAMERAISLTARASAVAALMMACACPSARDRSSCSDSYATGIQYSFSSESIGRTRAFRRLNEQVEVQRVNVT